MICEQTGVFRVNCIDCLDRTNVVQTAVARLVIDQQVRALFRHRYGVARTSLFMFYLHLLSLMNQ